MQYPHSLYEITQFEDCLVLHYLHFSLIILEYSRLHQQKLNAELTSKTLTYCKQILDFALKDTDSTKYFYLYLISFTYMSIYQHLTKEEKLRIIPDLRLVMNNVSREVNEFDNLNNLLFLAALKKIEV
ncbi:hypothetical protein CONCODRAFT_80205 [Conidiobolus coronatus NRRL 28638]|uniref:Uncharacterized protein n=1 Tax=Conidiobolus coronatus (strain ATCC 28846 / CBS 209.66 / NRRL 28638) TaxID=796925 RepID=A0A137NWX6_CONC2|nr:hypothetical protein CONCODRAFT_80205 [Conidiobolus coronatus NRRL 28638]|eukprot:KXN67340.1 hypothetical protein CONCODRAFT_80205 [Conidiobolus coronatus NRRL 28638]